MPFPSKGGGDIVAGQSRQSLPALNEQIHEKKQKQNKTEIFFLYPVNVDPRKY